MHIYVHNLMVFNMLFPYFYHSYIYGWDIDTKIYYDESEIANPLLVAGARLAFYRSNLHVMAAVDRSFDCFMFVFS